MQLYYKGSFLPHQPEHNMNSILILHLSIELYK